MQDLSIDMSDGPMRVVWVKPAAASRTGVIVFMDVFGLRPALYRICQDIAALGHHVFLPDLYYRSGAYGPYDAAKVLADPAGLAYVRGLRDANPITFIDRDAPEIHRAFAAVSGVSRPILVGYCMGAGRSLRAAHVLGSAVAGVATFHGGKLAIDSPESPHRNLGGISARIQIAGADQDSDFPAAQSSALVAALHEGGHDFAVEIFKSCKHGWCLPDNPIFDQAGYDKHLRRLKSLSEDLMAKGS